ncbi:MAG: TIGR01777 family oxidoreductase [Chloroherpetonaceae bacterium]|nr:TIGR01777 family oxidoreductase [Chloroherpetonaceae bacterium]
MKIVITGINGLIGEFLAKKLNSEGHSISALGRNPDQLLQKFPFLKKTGHLPRMNSESLDLILQDCDAVIHLAGAPVGVRWNDETKKEIYDSRILTTQAIAQSLQRLSRLGQKKFVFICASAVGYYGNSPHGHEASIFTEKDLPGHDFLSKVCVDWEKFALEVSNEHVRVVTIRTGIVLSTKSGALSKMIPPFQLFSGGPIGSGLQWVPWIHLEDEIKVIQYALESSSLEGPVNSVAPKPVLMNEFAKTLGKVLKRPSLISVPNAVLQVLFGEAAEVISEGQRVSPEKLIKNGFLFQFPELEGAISDIIKKNI